MKSAPVKIHFIPADKIKNQYDTGYDRIHGQNYVSCKTRIKHLDDNEYFLVYTTTKGEHEGINLDNLVVKLDKLDHPHIYSLEFYSYELNLDSKMKRNWDIWLIYETYKHNLVEYAASKKQSEQKTSEGTLWSYIENMLSVFAYLRTSKLSHKPIHPKNFLIIGKDESIRFDALDLGNYSFVNPDAKQTPPEFRAPEELSGSGAIDQEKAEIYQLGMIFLYIATAGDVEKVNKETRALKEKLIEVGKRFSKGVVEILKKMLSNDPINRGTFQDLYKHVKSGELKFGNSDGKKTISFAADTKEERKENPSASGVKKSLLKFEEQHHHGSPKSHISKHGEASPKGKLVDSETLRITMPLKIDWERKLPKLKAVHQFIGGEMSIIVVSIINIKSPLVEVVDLDINFPLPRFHGSVHADNGRIYIVGGKSESTLQVSNCYYYQDGELTLTEQARFSEKQRLDPGVVSIGDKIYVMGGSSLYKKGALGTCEIFFTEENKWAKMASMNHKAYEATFVNFRDEFIYKFGGVNEQNEVTSVIEKYSLKADKWTSLGALDQNQRLTPAKIAFGVQINSMEILVFGGMREEHEPVKQSFVLDCVGTHNGEVIKQVDVHCPKAFTVDGGVQNQIIVFGNELVFLNISPGLNRVCLFDGETYKEIKRAG